MFSLVPTCKLGGWLHGGLAAFSSPVLQAGAILFWASFCS